MMRVWKRITALFLAVSLCGGVALPCAAAEGETKEEGKYIVYLPSDTLELQAADGALEELTEIPYAEGYYTADSVEGLQSLLGQGAVQVIPNAPLELLGNAVTTNDPGAGSQWYLEFLGASDAWSAGYTGQGVTVALVDSGINQRHEDFLSANLSGYNFLGPEGAQNPAAYTDDHGHGTLTAGTIAAQVNNGLGGAGLTPAVSLLALRAFSSQSDSANAGSGTLATALSAIGYAMEQKVDVINLSIGGTTGTLKGMEPLLQQAAEEGILLISSCGNKGTSELYYPAAFDCVIGVGWVDARGEVADKSQHNESVFVTAPGVSIYGPGKDSPNAYQTNSGSSFAAPMVAALGVMAKQANPAIDQKGFEALLKASAEDRGDPGWDEYYGYGVISVSRFVQVLTETYGALSSDPTWILSFETNGGSVVCRVKEKAGNRVDLSEYCPVREGYAFTGWYADAALTKPISSVTLTENRTVYAGWQEKSGLPFTDVTENNWFYGDVSYVWREGLMNGTSSTKFAPEKTVTRGMVVTILYRMKGEPYISGQCPFADVKTGSYYENAILWASKNGIVTGFSQEVFKPDDPVTREQLAAILYRYSEASVDRVAFPSQLTDYTTISGYALKAMSWYVMNGIISGDRNNRLTPKGNATRGQVAAIMHRFCETV